MARTLPVLFLARIVGGASAGNTSTTRAAIAKITSREQRVSGIGFTFAAESLELILGPVSGGLFSPYGFTVSALRAASVIGPVFATSVFSLSMRGVYVIASVIAVVAVIISMRGIETAT